MYSLKGYHFCKQALQTLLYRKERKLPQTSFGRENEEKTEPPSLE